MSFRNPLFVKHDLDGFFGLFIDNLVQILLIVQLCALCGMAGGEGGKLLTHAVLPGAAVSILIGNLFYAWQARRVAGREERTDVTALPYGINTPSLIVYIYFVMLPVYVETKSAEAAWKMGLLACLGSGLIEFFGCFFAEKLRRSTPRAALLSTLAGIAIGFIAMSFALDIYDRPLIAMLPLAVILITYFSQLPFPYGLPGGFVAVLLGTVCAWVLPLVLPASFVGPKMDPAAVSRAWQEKGWVFPHFYGMELWEIVRQPALWWKYLSVIFPMGLFNLIGSLQNIESAEAAGDRFDTRSSLAANGVGTICAALCGSCFPTTIYIGHPGWKGLGARSGYSILNGFFITLICLTGTVNLINSLIPIQAGVAIVLWIGIIITAQAFMAVPAAHAPAVAVGLFPAIAAWGMTIVQGAFFAAAGTVTMQALLTSDPAAKVNGFLLHGLLTMERGYILTCMILSALCAFLIDHKFRTAAWWSLAGAVCAFTGLTHAYQLTGNSFDFLFLTSKPNPGALVFRADAIAAGYLLCAAFFTLCGYYYQRHPDLKTIQHD